MTQGKVEKEKELTAMYGGGAKCTQGQDQVIKKGMQHFVQHNRF